MSNALERISIQNRNEILQSQFAGNQKVLLIALQNLLIQMGSQPMDLALRMVVETAITAYLKGSFEALHAMGIVILNQGREPGNA